jgi:rubrerythrin
MSQQDLTLSLEQQFSLRKYEQQAKLVSRDELEDLFVEVIRQKMAQENIFKKMIRSSPI